MTVKEYFFAFAAIFFIALILSAPSVCAAGAKSGLKICANVLVPSLFPFAIPVVFLINTGAYKNANHKYLILFILSLLGGYPIGSKLISELYKSNQISRETAVKILPFCVNAGPAFIVIAVGKGILGNSLSGYILLTAHTVSAVIITVIFARKEVLIKSSGDVQCGGLQFSDNIVKSVHSAASSCISISAFLVFFSVINEYILFYSNTVPAIKYLIFLTEVTKSVSSTKNIYLISFMLGFAGFSIWAQIFAVSNDVKPNFLEFVAVRILHGILSVTISTIIIKTFDVSVAAISNGRQFSDKSCYSGFSLSISLLIMSLLLLISINSKKHSGNLIKDVL